jgi:hypothetical protein
MASAGLLYYSKVFIGLCILPLLSFHTSTELKFRKQLIAAESAESVGVFDVNGDQNPDIVSGSYWYEGPAFLNRHFIGQVERVSEYYDDFATIPMDVDGDDKIDFITGGWFSKTLRWRKNPGTEKEWALLDIAQTGNIETIRAWDIDGDGFDEIIPNTPGSQLIYYTLKRDKNNKALGEFTKTMVIEKHGHGLGFGDVNGDGRGDFIVSEGWIEAPVDRNNQAWKFHPDFNLKDASIPVIVADVNKDGLNDLIAGHGHSYGLYWYEQKRVEKSVKFIKHPIDPYHSQFHTMEWEDIDNDGQMELITGKRYRAHNGKDPGDNESPGLYYFKWNGESFTKHVISYGPFGEGKGTGIFFNIADLHKTGRKDIVVAGKDGLYVFFNEKP